MSTAPFILLVNPWIYDFAAYDLWSKPLGLLYIAALLKQNGFGVHLIDCLDPLHPLMHDLPGVKLPARKPTGKGHFYHQPAPKPDALQSIKNKRYKRFGITPGIFEETVSSLPKPRVILVTSMMTYWYLGVFEVITRLKTRYPDVPIVLGGVYATICHEHALRFSGADYIVRGPGESEVLRIVAAIGKKEISVFPYVRNPDSLPYPAHELLSAQNALPLLTARGCPFSCLYCASSRLFPGFSRRNPLLVADEIEHGITHYGATDFAFYDDAFLAEHEAHARPILQEIITRKLTIRLHFPNGLHIRYITQKLADLMMAAGCKTIRLGLETADADRQKQTGGKVVTEEFRRAAGSLRKAGFTAQEVGVYILAGLPDQEAGEVFNTIQMVQESGLRPVIAEYSPIPGTALWDRAVAASSFPLADEPLFHNNSLLPCQWDKFTVSDLEKLKQKTKPAATA